METVNKFVLFLALAFALSSHFPHAAQAVCVPRTFRYLHPSTVSPTPSAPQQSVPSAPSVPATPSTPPTPVKTPPTPATATLTPTIKTTTTPTPSTPAPSSPSTPPAAPKPASGLSSIIPGANLPGPEVKKICDATDDPLICLTYLPPFLHGKFDQNSILIAEINAIKNHTQVVIDLANKIIADPKTDSEVGEALDLCKENYDSVLYDLDDALKAVEAHDAGSLNSQLSAASADVSTCQDTFGEVTSTPSPLAAMDDITKKLCMVPLATLDSFKW